MALQATAHRDGYSYQEDIIAIDFGTIEKSKEQFSYFKRVGVITLGEYEDSRWIISNEVIKGAAINFQLDEVHFARETAKKLNCTLAEYQQAMRIVITSRLGYTINTLQADAIVMRNFADRLEIPAEYAPAQLLGDLLYLLPGESKFRTETLNAIDDISPLHQRNRQQRRLAHYQSYLRFAEILDCFWKIASEDDRTFYFPVWFWFKITGVLPLRPTECVLTPRNCIREERDRYYISVRRTRLKGKRQSSRYNIESDYEVKEYPIPTALAKTIQEYISATQAVYESDIDVLFCKSSQFSKLTTVCENDHHYSYANLHQCLSYFYREVIAQRHGYEIVYNSDGLMSDEIERVNLGDTRHIAMISLAVSGSSPTICKELAGHNSISISSHYYTNITEFLDVLGYERYREMKSTMTKTYGCHISTEFPVAQGYCQSDQVLHGNYSPCRDAVNSDGMPGSCGMCKWYAPRGTALSIKLPALCNNNVDTENPMQQISSELQQTCTLLKQAVDQLRQGLGNTDTVSCMLDRLAAQAQHYVHSSAIERMIAEREEF